MSEELRVMYTIPITIRSGLEETVRDSSSFLELSLDPNRPVERKWADSSDPKCRNFNTSYLELGTGPGILLASMPSSGNTWSRYLLEGLSGVFTGDLYHVRAIALSSFQKFRVGLVTIFQKMFVSAASRGHLY